MAPPREELLNVYDAEGNVLGARPRRAAKASRLAVGAVNVLLVNRRGQVLLQRRAAATENGGAGGNCARRYSAGSRVDGMLAARELAPNMAYLWLTQAHALISAARIS